MNINLFLNDGILTIAKTASRFYLKNQNGRHFLTNLTKSLINNASKRESYEKNGTHIPPFLIASIASVYNLHCTGCYARAGGSCSDSPSANEMSTKQWEDIFAEALTLGISFILLAGGEPLLRRDIIDICKNFPEIVFPVFTNGTLIDEQYISLFDKHRNIIPVLSIEGTANDTDIRRGNGIAGQMELLMDKLEQRGILYGLSVTVTSQNLATVTDQSFVSSLHKKGCGILFYVEYVPISANTESLVLSEQDLAFLEKKTKQLKSEFKSLILLSFPGDEKHMGGCLAAGRGFFHINPTGGAEPCPFSPYSVQNLKNASILDTLKSDFFKEVREIEERDTKHSGGCTLFRMRSEVETLL